MSEMATGLASLRQFAQFFKYNEFEIFVRETDVYTVVNGSHDDPSEHMYNVFTEGEVAVKCTCPHHRHRHADCKHMGAVEEVLQARREAHGEWRDWQQVQKEREEEERERAAVQAKASDDGLAEQEILHAFGEAEPEDPESVVYADEPETGEQVELDEVEVEDDDDEDRVEEADLMSKEEWRSLSSEGRRMAVAFL